MKSPERLATRLSVSFVLLFVIVFSGVVAVTLYYAHRTFQTSIDDNLQGLAETIDSRLEQQDAEPERVIEDLSSAAQFIELVDLNGEFSAASSNLAGAALPTYLRPGQRTENIGFHTFKLRKSQMRLVRYPLMHSGEHVGYVVIASPIPEVDDAVSSLAIIVVITGLLGMTVAVIGTVWLSIREARPLKQLTEQVQATAASGFEQSMPASTDGSLEARQLRAAFSNLVEQQREVLARERAFFADSSHVLRTPLAVLQGDIEQLEQGVYGKERQEVVAQARSSISMMARAVSGLLLLAREQESPQGLAWEVVGLSELLERQVAEAKVAAPQLSIASNIVPGIELAGDQHQLQELFASLVENACHYTPAGGSVQVSLEREGDDAIIEIRDTGIGFSPRDTQHAHERFYRGEAARRMFPGGSGLGLAIADRIARLHQGSLRIGPQPGGGTAARVRLPMMT